MIIKKKRLCDILFEPKFTMAMIDPQINQISPYQCKAIYDQPYAGHKTLLNRLKKSFLMAYSWNGENPRGMSGISPQFDGIICFIALYKMVSRQLKKIWIRICDKTISVVVSYLIQYWGRQRNVHS